MLAKRLLTILPDLTVSLIECYMAKISGPLLDRIAIHLEVPAVPFRELAHGTTGTTSESMREQVVSARAAQAVRFADSKTRLNAKMTTRRFASTASSTTRA